jgi:hypothetical protein
MKLTKACLALVAPLALVWACGSSTTGDVGAGADGAGAGGGGGALAIGGDGLALGGDAAALPGGGSAVGSAGTATGVGGSLATDLCGDAGCTCSNGKDDDGDGLVDGFDPECTGPLDNDEGSFATGIPGDNRDPKWQDCFFDGNSGAGDDKCRYATGCLTGELEQDHPDCELSRACVDFCAKLTPNGCDCFGCCTVQLPNGQTTDILTGSSCSLEQLGDENACPQCEKTEVCGNPCGRCELCPGKALAELPEDCGADTGAGGANTGGAGAGGGPTYSCDGGEQVCGPGLEGCGIGKYCSLGCCLYQPPR